MDTYAIDADRTRLTFAVRGVLRTRGEFTRVAGTVIADERGAPLSLEVAIDARSVRTGLAPRDLHLRTAGFLDARHYPMIAYRAEQFEQVEPGHYRVRGRLRLHGRDLPVTLEAALAPDDAPDGDPDAVRSAHVTAVLPRSAFAIPRNPILRALLLPLIGDEVAITADVRGALVREGGATASVPPERLHGRPFGQVS